MNIEDQKQLQKQEIPTMKITDIKNGSEQLKRNLTTFYNGMVTERDTLVTRNKDILNQGDRYQHGMNCVTIMVLANQIERFQKALKLKLKERPKEERNTRIENKK